MAATHDALADQRIDITNLEDLFRQYVAHPHRFWQGTTNPQAEKLETEKEAVNRVQGWTDADIASGCLAWARRRNGIYPPIYVTGLGGAGSHWLAGMLSDLPHVFDVGEVYLPSAFIKAFDANPTDARLIIDALHILHARQPAHDLGRAVNCAAGSSRGALYVRWDPKATVVRLLRDPRDQILSTTFRKPEYRQWVAPDESHAESLERRCAISRSDETDYHESGVAADVIVKYEDLQDHAVSQLNKIVHAASINASQDQLEATARRHDATTIRRGKSAVKSNLYQAESGDWREESLTRIAPIHSELNQVIDAQAYPFGSCLTPPPRSKVRERPLEQTPGLRLHMWSDEEWSTSAATGEALLGEVTTVRHEQIAYIRSHDLHGVCAARLDGIENGWLRGILDTPIKTLDLGTVPLTETHLETLTSHGSHLRALNLWRACAPSKLAWIIEQLPATTVVG